MQDPMEVHVQLFVHPGSNGDFHFETTDLPMGPGNYLYFRNCSHPGFNVHYDIQGSSDYVFPDATMTPRFLDEAVYSHAKQACPTTSGQWGQFKALEVKNGGKTLVVYNKNQSKSDFSYTLRVTNDGGRNYLPLDPGGGNQNGPVRANTSAYSLAAVSGLVVGSLLTLGVQALLQP